MYIKYKDLKDIIGDNTVAYDATTIIAMYRNAELELLRRTNHVKPFVSNVDNPRAQNTMKRIIDRIYNDQKLLL